VLPLASAGTADAASSRIAVDVTMIEVMPTQADSLPGRMRGGASPTKDVLARRDRLEMREVHATRVVAAMVDVQARCDVAVEPAVHQARRADDFPLILDVPVAARRGADPQPAVIGVRRENHLIEEAP